MYRLYTQVKQEPLSQEKTMLACGVLTATFALVTGAMVIMLVVRMVSAILRFFS